MSDVLFRLLNMGLTAGWLVLIVIFARLLLKKAPRWISVALWALVGIRLLVPVSLESVFSLVPSTQPIPAEILTAGTPAVDSGIPIVNAVVNPILSQSFSPDLGDSVNPLQIVAAVGWNVWCLGILGMGLYALISYLCLRKKVREAAWVHDNVWLCDRIESPFILGVFRPRIYIPSHISREDLELVLAHEKAHLRRRDHWWKPMGFLLLTVYWWNPLLWVGYVLLCRDIEFACDERVLKEKGSEIKKPYSEALINCSVSRKMISVCPLAFGEAGVKGRIKSVLNYKKPAFWIVLISLLACGVLSVCLLTDPISDRNEPSAEYVSLKNIESVHLEDTLENTAGVMMGNGAGYCEVIALPADYLNRLGSLEISSEPLSEDRSEDRFKDHTLVLQSAEDRRSYWSSVLSGLYVCFNGDFSALWMTGKMEKPTLTYRVKDPQQAAALWEEIDEWREQVSAMGESDGPENVTVAVKVDLRALYPQYFDLPTDNGLTVYVWQYGPNIYQYGLLPGSVAEHSLTQQMDLEPVLLPYMREIVDSYGLERTAISIVPLQRLDSSYLYPIDDEYQAEMARMFWDGVSSDEYVYADRILDSVCFDVDSDGSDELLLLLPGPTSEGTSYILAILQDLILSMGKPLENYTVFSPKDLEESEFSFVATENGWYRLKGTQLKDQREVYYKLIYSNGHIICSKIEE